MTRQQAAELADEERPLPTRVRSGELKLPEEMKIAPFLAFGGVVPGDYRRPWEAV
jgi:hypothetical protein